MIVKNMNPRRAACFIVVVFAFLLCSTWIIDRDNSQYESLEKLLNDTKRQIGSTKLNLDVLLASLKERCFVWDPDLPVIYAITPTYTRPVQKAELTRLSHTFRLVQNFHWIIVEDANGITTLVENVLKESRLNYTHIAVPTPPSWKRQLKEPKWKKPRGVSQRNAAIKWLRENRNSDGVAGVVYFADDDNTYALKLFDEMRFTRKVGVWPVGLVGGLMVEKPLLNPATGKVTGWNSHWRPERAFPVDMAGFAINLKYLLDHPDAAFTFNVQRGYQETALLSKLIKVSELEPKADNCTKVYVWHTRTEDPNLTDERLLRKKGMRSDENIEV